MSRRLMSAAVAAAILAVANAQSAPAGTMNYGDFVGASVTYKDVTEATSEGSLLFSAPTVVGDTLEFDPVNFFAEVDPGPGTDKTESTIFTVIDAKPGFFIDNVHIGEEGSFTLAGLPGAFGQAQVGAAFFYEVLALDGVAVGDGPIGHVNMQFTSGGGPNGGQFSLPGDAGAEVAWSGTAFLDLAAELVGSPYEGQRVTSIRLTFGNTLVAAAGTDASSFIRKNEIGGIVIRTNIPEPTSLALSALIVGTLGVVVARRRLK